MRVAGRSPPYALHFKLHRDGHCNLVHWMQWIWLQYYAHCISPATLGSGQVDRKAMLTTLNALAAILGITVRMLRAVVGQIFSDVASECTRTPSTSRSLHLTALLRISKSSCMDSVFRTVVALWGSSRRGAGKSHHLERECEERKSLSRRDQLTKLLQSRCEDDEEGGGPTMGGPGSQKLEGGATATSSPGSSNAWRTGFSSFSAPLCYRQLM